MDRAALGLIPRNPPAPTGDLAAVEENRATSRVVRVAGVRTWATRLVARGRPARYAGGRTGFTVSDANATATGINAYESAAME
jgi:hypothetical protein